MHPLPPLLRQWMLLRILSARHRGATVRELADEFAVNAKTVRRDLQALQQVGFPIEEEVADHGRKHWRLTDNGRTPSLNFNLTEVLSLYLGRRFLEPLAGTDFWNGSQSAFAKIRAGLGEHAVQYLEKIAHCFHHTAVGGGDYSGKAEIIDALMVGIEDRQTTFITYHSMRSTEPVTYDIYPLGLVYHRGSLYLIAYAPHHEEVRHYKVDRIDDAEVQPLKFAHPADFNLKQHLADCFGIYRGRGTGVRIKVKFLPEVARYVEESHWHASQSIARQQDGSLLLELRLGDTEEIKRWILSFGAKAVVLEPRELRQQLKQEISEMAEAYASEPAPSNRQHHARPNNRRPPR